MSDIKKECPPTASEAQNNALAGVGMPIKELVWRSSILNLASLNPENTAIRKAVYGIMPATGIKKSG